jgi:flagellar basal-body rod protein FlgB
LPRFATREVAAGTRQKGPGNAPAGKTGLWGAWFAGVRPRRGKPLPLIDRSTCFAALDAPQNTLLAPLKKIFRTWHSSCFVLPEEIETMFDNVFGIHEQALLLHGQRLSVLANNIANVDTPNYKARDIDFAEVLGNTDDGATLPIAMTNSAHMALTDGGLPTGAVKYRNPYQASLDGNTVEMPVEQAAFAENNVRYQASLNFINSNIAELKYAIAGQ